MPKLVRFEDMSSSEKVESLVAANLDEFYVENIIGYWYGQVSEEMEVSRGYEPEDDTIIDWAAVKDLTALDDYCKENPHLSYGI